MEIQKIWPSLYLFNDDHVHTSGLATSQWHQAGWSNRCVTSMCDINLMPTVEVTLTSTVDVTKTFVFDLWLMVNWHQLLTSFWCQFNIFCPLGTVLLLKDVLGWCDACMFHTPVRHGFGKHQWTLQLLAVGKGNSNQTGQQHNPKTVELFFINTSLSALWWCVWVPLEITTSYL